MGSSSYITNLDGEITQHMEYLPFGETLVEEHFNSNNSPYRFNAKELDAETGNYYYGARYYDPKFSIWLSVDPLAEEYPGWSPYNYTMTNPIRFIDPDGRAPQQGNPWPKPAGQLRDLFNYIGDKVSSGIDAAKNNLREMGKKMKASISRASNYLKEAGGGFNFYSKNGGGEDPGREGNRKTEMINADPLLQMAGFAKSPIGPKNNPKDYPEVIENILTMVVNTSEGLQTGGDLGDKAMEVTAQFADWVEETGPDFYIIHVKDSTATVTNEAEAQEFQEKAKQSIKIEENKLNID